MPLAVAFGSLKNQAEVLLRKLQQRVSEGVGPQTIVKLYNVSEANLRSSDLCRSDEAF